MHQRAQQRYKTSSVSPAAKATYTDKIRFQHILEVESEISTTDVIKRLVDNNKSKSHFLQ